MITALLAFQSYVLADDVIVARAGDFDDRIAGRKAFVEFYAPWCGFCQKLAPVWDELALELAAKNSDVIVVKVDCTDDAILCAQHDVRSYPTLIFIDADGSMYKFEKGERDLHGLLDFVGNYKTKGVYQPRKFVFAHKR